MEKAAPHLPSPYQFSLDLATVALALRRSSGAGNPAHGEGVMEPNCDGDGDAGKMGEGGSPAKADEGMLRTDCKEGTKEADQPMEEREQGEEAKTTEDVNDKPAIPSDASVAVAQEGKSDEAPNKNTPNKEGVDATQKLWSSPPPQFLADMLVEKLRHAKGLGEDRETWHSLSEASPWVIMAFPSFCKEIAMSARTSKMVPLVRCINEFVRQYLPHLS